MENILNRGQHKYNFIILVLALSASYAVKKYFQISGLVSFLIFFGLAAIFIIRGYGAVAKRSAQFRILYSLFPLLLIFIYTMVVGIYGDFDISSIVFHLDMGVGGGIPEGQVKFATRFGLSFLGITAAFWLLINLDQRFLMLDRTLFVPLLLINPMIWNVGAYLIGSPYDDRLLNVYHAPDQLVQMTDTKKNMIIIYAESTERTFAEIPGGDVVFSEMNQLASSGLEVKGIGQAANTGWSMAGFVTSQCGVPLQPLGLLSHNMYDRQKTFFPGISCLSDVLNKSGYHAEYINGSDHEFAGMTTFLKSHNFNEAHGLHNIAAADDYHNDWGLYDDTVFAYAEERIRLLHQADKPFVLSVATIGAHFPHGHPTQSCRQAFPQNKLPDILFSVKCTGYEINRFIGNLQREGTTKNTVIVIVSDHLMMKNDFEEQLNQKQRLNYFAVLADNIHPKLLERQAAMFDVFPTLLDLLGFNLSAGRAGLGVSLLSEHETLTERYGAEQVDALIKNDRLLARKIWSEPQSEFAVSAR